MLEETANGFAATIGDTSVEPATDGLAGDAEANAEDAAMLATAIDELEDEFAKQQITEDYFTVFDTAKGSTPFMLIANMAGQQIPDSCFSIEGDMGAAAHMEFFLSATIGAS